jgi:hypothetical protein
MSLQVSVEYIHEPEGWWGTVTNPEWRTSVASPRLQGCRDHMLNVLPFAVDERLTATSVMFVEWSRPGGSVKCTPDAAETFALVARNDPSEGKK